MEKVSLRRIRLNGGGYDDDGRYYGIGCPLYRASCDDSVLEFRADDRESAKEHVLGIYPSARFYR